MLDRGRVVRHSSHVEIDSVMEPWVWPIAIGICISLLGGFYALFRKGTDRTEERLDEHVKDDIQAHERLKAVEIKVDQLEREVAGIRERWHDLRSEISQTLAGWYMQVVKMIGKDDH